MVQTAWVTGMGESFSNCNSTIARVSSGLLGGKWATRMKTFSGGSQATFNLFRQSELQLLPTIMAGNGSPVRTTSSRLNTNDCASNCQRWRESSPTWSTLQECQRAISEKAG